jgi:hypothetical protein
MSVKSSLRTARVVGSVTAGNALIATTNPSVFADGGTPGGSGITELTGDVTAGPGSGSQVATINKAALLPLLTILTRSTNQSINNSTWTAISWDTSAVQDDVSAFSSGTPTLVTVPSGYTRVRITGNTGWENNSTGNRYDRITKNGTADGNTILVETGAALNESNKNWCSRWLTVTTGDTLTLMVIQTSGSAKNFSGTGFPAASFIQFEWAA